MARYRRSKSEGKIPHKKTIIDGIVFDSKMESQYYSYLKDLENKKAVSSIELQPQFLLQDKYIIVDGQVIYGENKLFNKLKKQHKAETIRAINYKADFRVTYADGHIEVVDVKGLSTPEFEIKRKMFMAKFKTELKVLALSKGQWTDFYVLKKEKAAKKRENKKATK